MNPVSKRMAVEKKFRVALIGCGRVGAWLEDDPLRAKPATHMGGLQKLLNSPIHNKKNIKIALTALCDIDEERLQKCQERWNVPHAYTQYKELIDKEKPDIVTIATWTATHHDIAVYAAQNGVKGIVLEKPVAVSIQQAEAVIQVCNANNVKLVINHERRWDPLYIKIKQLMNEGTLGPLKAVYGNVLSRTGAQGDWKKLIPAIGGGPLLHDGTHLVDMIRFFAGDIADINGSVKREDKTLAVETSASAMMTTCSGVTVFLEAGGMRDYFNFELDLHFKEGRIKIGNGIREFLVARESKRYSGFRDLVKKEFPEIKRDSDPFTGALLEVIKAIESDEEPFSSGRDGVKAMEVIFAIYRSASLKGKTVSLPLKPYARPVHPLIKMFKAGML